MSPAGLNRICSLLTFSYPQDDSVGGAVPSGTVVYENLPIRIETKESTLVLLEQGLEVPVFYSAQLFPGNITVKHNDQIVFTAPTNDWFYEKKFRILNPRKSSNHPSQDRNQIYMTLRRWEESHANDVQ